MLPKAALALLTCCLPGMAAEYRIEANIRYAPHAETVLDILQASAPALKNRPAVVVFHGGGWVEGKKEDAVLFTTPFLEHGMVVVNVEYRLASVATAPAAVEDAFAALAWLRDRAAEYKVDPKQILVTGYSAGAQLAMLVAMAPESAGFGSPTKIAAVINFFGVADVADQLEGSNSRPYAAVWIPDQPDRMALARRLSPVMYVRKGLAPVLSIHGDADDVVPYSQSVELTKALKAAGDDAELITVPGGKHGFEQPDLEKIWPQVFKWLKKRKITL